MSISSKRFIIQNMSELRECFKEEGRGSKETVKSTKSTGNRNADLISSNCITFQRCAASLSVLFWYSLYKMLPFRLLAKN